MSTGAVATCGCAARPRRRCLLCATPFVACSRACLERHTADRHGGEAASAAERALASVVALNANPDGAQAVPIREAYADHRDRLTRLLRAVQRGDGLCVLGAGNGDDLDLPALLREFGEVHLVDVDGAALARAASQVEGRARARLVLHGGVDLTGLLGQIDGITDAVPGEAALAAVAASTATAVASSLGRTFDVVLSDCLVSQLPMPFRDALVLDGHEHRRLCVGLHRIHLATMAALCRPGGTGVVAFDVLSSHDDPSLLRYASPSTWEALGAELAPRIGRGQMALDPSPADLLAVLGGPDLARVIERPRLTEPWTWNLGDGLQLVCAILWNRIDDG